MLGALVLLALTGRHPIHSSSASIVLAHYLTARFRLTDADGHPMALGLTQVRSDGSVLVIQLSGDAPGGLRGARVWHGVLTEKFSDQVNFVQARYQGHSTSLLFAGRDGPKSLP